MYDQRAVGNMEFNSPDGEVQLQVKLIQVKAPVSSFNPISDKTKQLGERMQARWTCLWVQARNSFHVRTLRLP